MDTTLQGGIPLDDADIADNTKVVTVNGLSHAWFNNVIVKINGTVIESVNNKYAHRGDLQTRLHQCSTAKEGGPFSLQTRPFPPYHGN